MYRLRGAHGLAEGPYSVEQLQVWLREGRVLPSVDACREGESTWLPLSEWPDFRPVSPEPSALPPPLPSRSTSPPPRPAIPSARPAFSRLAIVSVVLGVVGFLIVPGIIGIVCGLSALVSIRRHRGRIRGAGLAVLGLVLSFVTMAIAVVAALVFIRQQEQQQQPWRTAPRQASAGCWQNLPKLGKAVMLYANDHGDVFPASTNWCDAVKEYVPSLGVFTCPGAPVTATSVFAFNQELSGKTLDDTPPDTVMLFECAPGWNATGGFEAATPVGLSPGLVYVYTVGGQVSLVPLNGLSHLRWKR